MPNEPAELSGQQRRMLIDTRQQWMALKAIKRRALGYVGSMSWQKNGDRQYLVRKAKDPVSGVFKNQSLGLRAPETEQIYEAFQTGRTQVKADLAVAQENMKTQSAINSRIGLGRVPIIAAGILRSLDEKGLLGKNVQVVGTNALYAYEAAAGVHFDANIIATGDIDFLMDARRNLKLTIHDGQPEKFISLLKGVEASFAQTPHQPFRANTASGYLVDLIKPEPNPPWKDESETLGGGSERGADLVASPIMGLTWLESAPKFETVAIDEKGWPVPLSCPDPCAFAIYKYWMGREAKGRDPVKRRRDVEQAHTLHALIESHLVDRRYDREKMKNFPAGVLNLFEKEVLSTAK